MTEYYYHVTTKDNVPAIMKDGLIPGKGSNSANAGEQDHAIYLAPSDSVPHWFILTGSDTVLKIDRKGLQSSVTGSVTYGEHGRQYDEIRAAASIPPKWISISENPSKEELDDAMRSLAVNYLYMLSHMCYAALVMEWTLLHGNTDEDMAENLADSIMSNLDILSRIDFSILSQEEMARHIQHYSNDECFVTFADSYFDRDRNPDIPDAGKRCWEHLANVQIEQLKDACLALNQFIEKEIPAYVRWLPGTGGFCM